MTIGDSLTRFATSSEALLTRLPELKKILVNFSWLSVERVFVMFLSLVVGIWVARYLGPEKYGLLSYSLALLGIVGALPRLGIDEILVRELLDKPHDQGALLGTALVTRIVSASLACLAVIAYALSDSSDQLRQMALLIFSALLFRDTLVTLEAWFKSQIEEKHLVWSRAAGSFAATLLRLLLILIKADFLYFCLTFLVDALIYGAILGIQFRRALRGSVKLRFQLARLPQLLKLSWPLYLSSIAVVVYMKFDQVILQSLIGSETVGHYAAAVRICEIFHFVPAAIASSVFPSLIRAESTNTDSLFLGKYLCLMAFFAYLLSVPLAVFAAPIALLLYGKEFSDTGAILAIYAFNFVPIFLGTARNQYLLSVGKTHISLLCTIIGMLSNVTLCLTLIPLLGAIGAALAALISLLVSDFFSSFLFRELRPIAFKQVRALLLLDVRSTVRDLFHPPGRAS